MKLIAEKTYTITYDVLHQNFEERNVSYADTFTWDGKPFEKRTNQSKTVYTRRKRNVQPIDGTVSSVRGEETETGSLIIADKISVISRYLKGPARRPFLWPRNLYVIIIHNALESNFQQKTENVMIKLWKDYGIADAILMMPCNGNSNVRDFVVFFYCDVNLSFFLCRYFQLIGTYFPFKRADKTNSHRWGIFQWLNLIDIDYQDKYLLRKFDNLNKYPLKISMFPRYPTALEPEEMPDIFLTSYFMKVLNESRGYGGIDGLLLGNMAIKLNFSAVIVAPNGSDFGYRLSNGIFIGMCLCMP